MPTRSRRWFSDILVLGDAPVVALVAVILPSVAMIGGSMRSTNFAIASMGDTGTARRTSVPS